MASYKDLFKPGFTDPLRKAMANYPIFFTPQSELTATAAKMKAEQERRMPDPQTGRPTAEEMISMRLRYNGMSSTTFEFTKPWDHMSAYHDHRVAVVLVVTSQGKHVTLEDQPELFPSDTLITQLKLLIETGNIK